MKLVVLAAAALALIATPAFAKTSAIVVSRAWIAAPLLGAPTAAAYVSVKNDGAAADTLVSATTPLADALQLHSMSTAGGIMRMRPATGGLAISSGGTLDLVPGGPYHFMLIRPKHPLKPGERVPATLTFARAGAVEVVFVVAAPVIARPTLR